MNWDSKTSDQSELEEILNNIELLDTADGLDIGLSLSELPPELESHLESLQIEAPQRVKGREFSMQLRHMTPQSRSLSYKQSKLSQWYELGDDAKAVFQQLKSEKTFSVEAVQRLVRQYTEVFSQDRNILLTLSQMPQSTVYNPSEHAMKVSILAICIGTAMGYTEEQVQELGVCAFVNDFGMTFMEDVYLQSQTLKQADLLKLRSHPIISANIIDGVKGMPSMASLVVYQVHEREDGTGYPKQRQGRFIHEYAKIIAVADVFQAFCSPRAHRASLHPFEAMTKVVGLVRIGSLSPEVVKPFMTYTSLYPVGCLVKLSDNSIGRVVQSNGVEVKYPSVSILIDHFGIELDAKEVPTLDLRRREDLQIVDILKESDVDFDKLAGL